MRVRLMLGWLLVLSLLAAIGYAQEPAARSLSLTDALVIARRNNPDFLQTLNDRWTASRQLTSATANLLTPSVDVSGTAYASQAGERSFFGQSISIPGVRQTSYSLGLNYRLAGSIFANRGLSRAQLHATDEDIAGAQTLLETSVRQQYLNVLQAQAQEALARRALERAQENLSLSQARLSVGQGTLIDVRRAEVEKGQAEVGVLRAQQTVENQSLVLFQRLGVPAPEPVRVQLTDSFPVVEPRFTIDTLMALALAENPGLRALRAREGAARWGVRSANSQYLPSMSVSAGVGRTSTRIDTTGATWQGQKNPWSLSLAVSLPLYDGFQRNVERSRARAQQDDVRQAIRARELQVRAEVTAALRSLTLAYRTIAVQDRNKAASSEALELATQRYRVGSGTYIELLDARVAAERAEAEYVTAIYDYHKSIAALENAVGRPLR